MTAVSAAVVSALRERLADIPQLVWFLINRRQLRVHRNITEIAPAALDAMQR